MCEQENVSQISIKHRSQRSDVQSDDIHESKSDKFYILITLNLNIINFKLSFLEYYKF